MNVFEAIEGRRSIKQFAPEPVERAEIERLLQAAVLAPNHRLTQPWRFVVLGPQARRAYGRLLGVRKAAKLSDAAAADAVVGKLEAEYGGLPGAVAFAVRLDENPEVRDEDIAATWMAVENFCLAGVELGLGTHLKTGAVLEDSRVRAALDVPEGERLIVLVQLGRVAEQPAPKPRTAAAGLTRWLP